MDEDVYPAFVIVQYEFLPG